MSCPCCVCMIEVVTVTNSITRQECNGRKVYPDTWLCFDCATRRLHESETAVGRAVLNDCVRNGTWRRE